MRVGSWGREARRARKGLFNVCWAKLNALNLCQANLVMGGFVLVTHGISVLPVLWDSSHCCVNSLCTWTDVVLSLSDCGGEGLWLGERAWGEVRSPQNRLLEKHIHVQRGSEGWLTLPAWRLLRRSSSHHGLPVEAALFWGRGFILLCLASQNTLEYHLHGYFFFFLTSRGQVWSCHRCGTSDGLQTLSLL